MLGANLSQRLGIGETSAAIILGFAGLFLGFTITALISRRISGNREYTPIITRIIRNGPETPELSVAIDPVCKMVVNPVDSPLSYVYRDKTYYFCHPKCKESFTKNPETYL
jgi:YHS domain-containing protein